jgi:hypothetical protein
MIIDQNRAPSRLRSTPTRLLPLLLVHLQFSTLAGDLVILSGGPPIRFESLSNRLKYFLAGLRICGKSFR